MCKTAKDQKRRNIVYDVVTQKKEKKQSNGGLVEEGKQKQSKCSLSLFLDSHSFVAQYSHQ